MFIIQIGAFFILLLCIAWKFKIQLVETIPVGCSLLVLMLYFLAFFKALSVSDLIAAAVLLGTLVYLVIRKERRKELICFACRELFSPGALIAVLMTVIVTLCVLYKPVSWWDDYNFWGTDAKALFYLDGFAGKYANAAPEFGDYPPGTQLIKWWFLHFSPSGFQEGLMFAGYYFMNLAFLFPLLKVIRKKNPLVMAAGAAALWLFPAVAELFWCEGCCADLTMALVYGGFLAAVADREGRSRFFYYGRQALFLMILVLCKNTGIIWAAFGLVFDYGYHFLARGEKECSYEERKADRRSLLLVTLLPMIAEGSWLGFCLLNRRVAKLTGAAFQMAFGKMNIPAYQEDMVKAFGEAFFKWPFHRGNTIAIDLTPVSLYLLLLVFVFLLYRFRLLDQRKAWYVGVFFAISGIVFYVFNLLSHLTIFAVETQYLEPYGMILSIERYGAPFTIGGLYLAGFYAMNGKRPWMGAAVCLVFVLFTTDYRSAYQGLWGYRDTVNEVLARREEIVDSAAGDFLRAIGEWEKTDPGNAGEGIISRRVLYLRDISDLSWVRNTYVSFEAAPVPVMYGSVDTQGMKSQDLANAIKDSHAGFLYADKFAGDGAELFEPFLEGEFEYGCLYRIVRKGAEFRLIRA